MEILWELSELTLTECDCNNSYNDNNGLKLIQSKLDKV